MNPTWRHLVRRFFATGTARALNDHERSEIERWLPDARWRSFFFAQPATDQRHGYRSGRLVADGRHGRAELIQAAVLHDIGKRHAGLGIIRRTIAGAADKLGVHLPGAFALYTAHGAAGADELAAAGAPALVVEFTRHHHGARPAGISAQDWQVLLDADEEA